jgi:hypothetical protein
MRDLDGGEFGAAQGASEPDEHEGTIAQAARIVGDWDEQTPYDGRGRRDLLARYNAGAGGLAPDAGDGFRHANVVGRNRAPRGAMQIADRGTAEVNGVGGEVAAALAGQEGGDVGAAGGEGRQTEAVAPGAPGAVSIFLPRFTESVGVSVEAPD